ncbi:MAG: cytochrome-c oxidase, cbb3-type subunit I [Planctomycetota bacterium]
MSSTPPVTTPPPETRHVIYNDRITRAFVLATLLWGVVAMLAGILIAAQLSHWQANLSTSWLTFGRLRPLHTNGAIFAFVGNMMFAGIYYSTQRLLKTRMASDLLSWVNFWGWQLIIVLAVVTLPLGLTQGKEYAELIWPVDILVALVWVVFAVNFFWTLARRNERNLYVSLWFYIATVVTIPVLYIVNNLQLPTSLLHSYSIYGGVQDALVQWWYGHNAVGFFLTTPILGIMYYFLPKAAERPVYSYRLSVVHFWALVFVYIWAGPHHLLNTALPEWAQTLGMVFSLMLWAPSWGGMLNGLLTLRGAWDKLRTDPIIKFFIVAVTFYGMSTLEGPLLSIKSVNALGHYTDWIIGHVHGGTLGWNVGMAAGMLYWLVPRLWNTKLYSIRLADAHFWISTFGMLLYVVAMWVSGLNQGLFWRALDAEGYLANPDFVELILSGRFLYMMRLIGGTVFLAGFVLMAVNLALTMRAGRKVEAEVRVIAPPALPSVPALRLLGSSPVLIAAILVALAVLLGISDAITGPVVLMLATIVVVVAILMVKLRGRTVHDWHDLLSRKSLLFTVLVLIAILIGGLAELIPSIVLKGGGGAAVASAGAASAAAIQTRSPYHQTPYTPLELEGREIYVREGCYVCHSQMIRPARHEVLRYGDYSRLEESVYDRPFQWGSKRTGPDLQRIGGKFPDLWHYQHMIDPRSTSPGSIMPPYPWLADAKVDLDGTPAKMRSLVQLGVPYAEDEITNARAAALAQGETIAAGLAKQAVTVAPDSHLVALIAYLQRLGKRAAPPSLASSPPKEGSLGGGAAPK